MSPSRDLASLIEEHLRRRTAERLSRSRLFEDRRALSLLEKTLRTRFPKGPIPIHAVTPEDLDTLFAGLQARGLSVSALGAYIASLHVFFAGLAGRGLLLADPSAHLKRPRGRGLPRNVPTQEDIRKLLAAPDLTTEGGVRDRAILELLYGSGLRRNEALRIKLRDIDLSERTAFIREGKGKKDRAVPITEAAARAVAAYVRLRPAAPHPELFLGVNEPHRPLAPDCFVLAWRRYVAQAGLRAITPHALRHACALHLLENGADIVSIKNLLGHASLATTAVYLSLTTKHLREAIERHHPRERD